jgi:hypothetical protein
VRKTSLIHWPVLLIATGAMLLFVVSLTASVLLTYRQAQSQPVQTPTAPIQLAQKKPEMVPSTALAEKKQEMPPLVPLPPPLVRKEAAPEEEVAEEVETIEDFKNQGPPPCQTYGTSVDFVTNPKRAARWAQKEEKLLFMLHVSGNFEDSAFT